MDNLCPTLYRSYGKYVNEKKMVPLITDGLIPVQRRLLLACHYIAKNYIKTAKILAEAMGRWHPHNIGEGPLENLVHNGFVDGSGQWGERIGIEPTNCAAMRYTKARANPFVEEVAFKYIDHVPWREDELDPEPISLPTMLPFCLMGNYEMNMIAFGFKTEIPVYEKKDLLSRIISLLDGTVKKPTIIPKVPGCKVLSGDYDDILVKGVGKINIQGIYTVDESKSTVTINGWNPRFGFETVLRKIDKYKEWSLLTNGDIGFLDQTGKGDNCSKIVFSVAKQRNVPQIFDRMKEAISQSLKSSLTYNIYVISLEGEVQQVGVDDILLSAYGFHKSAFESYLKTNINKLHEAIKEIEYIRKIKPHISSIKETEDYEESLQRLHELSGVEKDIIRSILDRYKIKKLLTFDTDGKFLMEKLNQFENQLNNIEVECLSKYKNLLNQL